jgi:hypothetical protein
MDFYNWMVAVIGLASTSAYRYSSAIYGVISDWIIENGISHRRLDVIDNLNDFREIENRIRELPIFQTRNTVGHNMYSCALERYREYLVHIG